MRTSLLLLCLAASVAAGEPDPGPPTGTPKPSPLMYTLTVRPAVEDDAPARYPLLPTFRERTPGNAAVYYQRAISLQRGVAQDLVKTEQFDKALEKEPRKLAGPEIEAYLQAHDRVFRELRAGAGCSACDWQLDERINTEGLGVILEEIQHCRGLAAALKYRVRWLLGQGRIDEAMQDIQTGVALGRHVGEGPTLIVHLVGIAIDSIFLGELSQVMQAPGSPNLYRSLALLPSPFFRAESVVEGEQRMMESTLQIQKIGSRPPGHEEAVKVLATFADRGSDWGEKRSAKGDDAGNAAALAKLMYPKARAELLKRGFKEEELKKLTREQVAVTDLVRRIRGRQEHLMLAVRLPYPEGIAAFKLIDQRDPDRPSGDFVDVLNRLLAPAVAKVRGADIRLDRQIAMLRTIEALRLYAAENGGKLPEKLEAIAGRVTLPADPATGKPFTYRPEGRTFKLTAVPYDGREPSASNSIEYAVTVVP